MPLNCWFKVCVPNTCFFTSIQNHFLKPICSLFSVVRGLSVSLPTILLSASLSAADRKQQLNAVKMSVFLICKLTEFLESDSYRETIVIAPSKVHSSCSFCIHAMQYNTIQKCWRIVARWWDQGKYELIGWAQCSLAFWLVGNLGRAVKIGCAAVRVHP